MERVNEVFGTALNDLPENVREDVGFILIDLEGVDITRPSSEVSRQIQHIAKMASIEYGGAGRLDEVRETLEQVVTDGRLPTALTLKTYAFLHWLTIEERLKNY